MTTLGSRNDDEMVPFGIKTCWIQKTQDSPSNFPCILPRNTPLVSDEFFRHKRRRSFPSLGQFVCTEPQQHFLDTGRDTKMESIDPNPSHRNDPLTTIRICNCTYTTFLEHLSSLCDAVVLWTVEEIHFQNIRNENLSEEPNPDRPSRSLSTERSISSYIVALLKQTKPKRLILRDCDLQMSDLLNIMDVLRRNHSETLEHLDLRYNGFAPRVLQWLISIHLGSFRSLQEVYLRQGIRCIIQKSVRDAIVTGLENTRHHTLRCIDLFHWDRSVEHLLDINCVGRRVFQMHSFPFGLWPFLLERAMKRKDHSTSLPRQRALAREASAIYHMLRNTPELLQNCGRVD
ncbi:hypothetical protein IV203_030680 [Nitzschia inconspicua]|uniref:Uncharacterized protein n=1 Tax=Nitzschia inconspicua TaxID=303405 RepID=A0A9K3LTK5_9STRA|nr:hypothetical protein IV203_030680 [Nitzschia inconspicua]